ncbi:MAG TPA: oligopeptide:H+ symporter [Steroidobacteraceae bacterium]|jgi:POT family proton-dependent oligopeptide transporter|nr:oligopeptide:H+ symporter [Steroidobacteraceae bacterium]
MARSELDPVSTAPQLWGHPRQLWMLLGVTVWLNFSFYGFRAYLAPYLASFFVALGPAAAQRQADLLSSGLLALMYATPILGGYAADKWLGETRALALSLWLTTASLVLMASSALAGLELGMACYALSTGLNIPLTVLIGRNYAPSDSRREAAYTLFYLAINAGGFIAPLICADLVGRHFGYRWGFLAAAGGNLLAAILFQWRRHTLGVPGPQHGVSRSRVALPAIIAAIAILAYPMALLLSRPQVLSTAMYVLMGLLVLYFIIGCMRRRDRVQTQRYLALLLLFVALVLFWALSLQSVTSLNFFARDYVSAPFDYTVFQSANPLFILLFAPLLAMLWPWLARRSRDPSTPRKFGIGLLLVALSYGLVVAGIRYGVGTQGKISWTILAGCYLLQTLGELAVSPIGYSLVGLLAAPEETSLAMGGWFFGVALAYQLAGWIATRTVVPGVDTAAAGIAAYGQVYQQLFLMGLPIALLYLLGAPWIRKLMPGVH